MNENNDIPVWDEPPEEAYQDDRSFDNGNFNEEDFNSSLNNPISIIPENQEIPLYSYPRSVIEFNKSIKFGLGIDYELAKNSQQKELQKRQSNYRATNSQNSNGTQHHTQEKPTAPTNEQKQANSSIPEKPTAPTNEQGHNNIGNVETKENQTPAPAQNENGRPASVTNNITFLDTTPLLIIMDHFSKHPTNKTFVKHVGGNLFDMNGYRIRVNIEQNKWYNIDTKKGNTNALSLTRELIAIHDDINLNDRELFKILCSRATREVNQIQRNIEKYTDLKDLIALTQQENSHRTLTKEEKEALIKDQAEEEAKKKAAWKALREQLNAIPVRNIAEWLGATPGEDGQPNLWKFHTTSHNIAINGQRWKNWNHSGKGGFGAIDFMKQYISITESIPETEEEVLYKKAFNVLLKEFGDVKGEFNLSSYEFQSPFSFPHILPGKTNEIRDYLHDERDLPIWLINKQISNGVLFAGFPSDWEPDKLLRESEKMRNSRVWATFLAPNGMAAEMRGIDPDCMKPKLQAKGSEKNTGGYLVPAEKSLNEGIIAICEAAIDASSYSSLYPGRSATSVMGATVDLAIELAFEADEKGLKIHLNFDNDFAGNSATYQFHKKIQDELEDLQTYNEYLEQGKIKYFELGIQIFKESLKQGITYYFDMDSKDQDAIEAGSLFLHTLSREMSKEEIKSHLVKGRLKINNVCPSWGEMQDVEQAVKNAINSLSTNPKCYFYPDPIKDLDESINHKLTADQVISREKNHQIMIQKRTQFIEDFHKMAGPENLARWKLDKRLPDSIKPLAKDWNEWMKYQLKNNKTLKLEFEQREKDFSHYNELAKTMKPSELGNSDKLKGNKKRP